MCARPFKVGQSEFYLPIEATRTKKGRIQGVRPVGCNQNLVEGGRRREGRKVRRLEGMNMDVGVVRFVDVRYEMNVVITKNNRMRKNII